MTTRQIKVFYAHSSHRESVQKLYEEIAEYFDTNALNIKILDVDTFPSNNSSFLGNLVDNLLWADIFVCDVTPDFIPAEHIGKEEMEITPCINANVMYELGYFEHLKDHRDVIMILNQDVCECVPSMLRGHYITRYQGNDDGRLLVIERIKDFAKTVNEVMNEKASGTTTKIPAKSFDYFLSLIQCSRYWISWELMRPLPNPHPSKRCSIT